MTNRKPSEDLSKEQILESIGRIVSEGESRGRSAAPGVPPPAPPRRKPFGGGDVLDLVDVVDEQGNVIPPGQAAERAPAFSFPPKGERPPPRTGDAGRATDEQVLEALKPMLQTWLDIHLPPMVERLVGQELQRAGRRSKPE